MAVSHKSKIFFGFTGVLIAMGFICGVSVINVTDIALQSPLTTQSREILSSLERIARISAAADAAVHRYVLTGDPAAARAYRGSRMELQASLAGLRQTANESSEQRLRSRTLDSALMSRFAALDRIVSVAAGNRESAQVLLKANGPLIDDTVRMPLAQLTSVERAGLTRRVTRTAMVWFLTMAGIVMACLIAMFAVVWAAFLVRREIRERDLTASKEKQARALLDSVMEGCEAAVHVRDTAGRFLVINRYAASLYASDPETLRGSTVRLRDSLAPDASKLIEDNSRRVMESLKPMTFEETFVLHGNERTFLTAKYPLLDRTGKPYAVCTIATDISTRKQAEAALAAAKDAAEQASQFKDQFLSTMSHELRTPLNAVIGFSELLSEKRYGQLNPKQADYVQMIHTAGHHLLQLINDILDLSKIEAGRLDLALEDLNVKTIVGDVLSSLKPLADKRSIGLTSSIPARLTVRADATRLQQVLTNLVANAIKFSPEGAHVAVSAAAQEAFIRLDVADDGPGIPVEEQKLIFESFYRAKQTRGREGAGLGLAITKRLVEAHGGEFGLESHPGQGSRFFFTLPAGKGVPEPVERPAAGSFDHGLILVIEDDGPTAQLVEAHLTSAGYRVRLCDEPRRAAELAAQLLPAAITLDVLMQPIAGWEVLAQLKERESTAGIPVILMSVVEQRRVAALLGADEYFVEHVKREDLLNALERCLAGRDAQSPGSVPLLVVDDDAAVRETIQGLLTESRFEVFAAADAVEAEGAIAAKLPAVVVLDLMLPGTSGFDLLERWRADPRTAAMKVLILTAKDLSVAEERWLRQRSAGLVSKATRWRQSLVDVLEQTVTKAPEGRAYESASSVG